MLDKFKDECGVFGIFGHPEAANMTYLGLYALQHRGQESAGIAASDGRDVRLSRAMGYVADTIDGDTLSALPGELAIGHVRYSTAGESRLANAQPILIDCAHGQIAIGHNGNLVNAGEIRDHLVTQGSIFQSSTDTEVILHLYARSKAPTVQDAIVESISQLQGAFSLVLMTADKLIAVRDPHGFRPLAFGRLGDAWVVCSETCAMDLIGAAYVRDVEPGELVILSESGVKSVKPFGTAHRSQCIFEHVYFARPDSIIDGVSVYGSRLRMGEYLAEKIKREFRAGDIDVVMPIPETSRPAAMQLAMKLGLDFREGFFKNRYVGRTFIMPGQSVRKKSVRQKLSALPTEFKGKNVLLVDDSIVRGTTSREIVNMARDAGANKVYFASAAPPVRFPNVYGIDMPTRGELIAHSRSDDEIMRMIEADGLVYQDIDAMKRSVADLGPHLKHFEASCFDGVYITGDISPEYLDALEAARKAPKPDDPEGRSQLNLNLASTD